MDTTQSDKPKPRVDIKPSYRAREWRISPRATLLSARRYSAFVRVMKGALPMAALALAIAVISYSLQSRDSARLAMSFESLAQIEGDLTMIKPRLSGLDENGLPFVITARSASQTERGSDLVRLVDVAADINLKGGYAVHVTAVNGVVDTKNWVLQMSGGIELLSADGYDAKAPAAVADLKAGTVHGENGIEARGGFGEIAAERFAFDGEARRLTFSGRVRMLLSKSNTFAP